MQSVSQTDDWVRLLDQLLILPVCWTCPTNDQARLARLCWSIDTVKKRIDSPDKQWCPPHKYFFKLPSLTRWFLLFDSSNIDVPVANSLCGQTRKMLNTYFDGDLDLNVCQTVHGSTIPHMNWQWKRSAQCHILQSTSVREIVVELKHVAVSCLQHLNLLESWWDYGWGIPQNKNTRYSGIN